MPIQANHPLSSASVSGSNSVHAPSSTFAAGAGSAVRAVPAGSTTSPVAVTTTASGEIKTTRRRRRPNESYSTIIIKAIRNSPLQRLKLSEIYDYVSREIPTMDGNDKGWQNTVRHNLSHNKCFRRIVVKDEDLPGSADDDDGDSKPSNGGKSKQAKRGKGGCWVLVPENLEEHISSSRPKKSSTDQVQSPGVPGAGSGGLTSSTSPKSHGHHTVGSSGDAVIPKATTSSTGGAYLSAQLSKDCHRHPHHQQQHHDASYPYLPPHYPSSSPSSSTMMMNQPRSSSAAYQSFTATTHPSQHNYNSSGDEWDHDSESDDGQSEHSVLSADRENDDDDEYEGDEAMDAKGEDDTVSHYSSSRPSPSRSPSASSLSVTSSPMEIEEADGGNGAVSFSSLPTTGRRRPGMSIQNMLN
ncbi:Forkhead box protein I2 [Mortierella hygrophila]|uniref:Forkhead box protein I2 n=1 Tax=Mortierella hygrophila TaxID=979708 RepID=A0A9P6JZH2_9FUNG|nr:Forkhead box protein I2 [Mortierella hygrophila]